MMGLRSVSITKILISALKNIATLMGAGPEVGGNKLPFIGNSQSI